MKQKKYNDLRIWNDWGMTVIPDNVLWSSRIKGETSVDN